MRERLDLNKENFPPGTKRDDAKRKRITKDDVVESSYKDLEKRFKDCFAETVDNVFEQVDKDKANLRAAHGKAQDALQNAQEELIPKVKNGLERIDAQIIAVEKLSRVLDASIKKINSFDHSARLREEANNQLRLFRKEVRDC